ncbi:MAG: DUF302 domain-containing protein [Patescibacteria group bacterium]|nr:DUF302 domain-containing protein [Patescibacteria group bacterium]
MNYGYKKQTPHAFEEAVEAVKTALAAEGFGVLTEIDVKETMKKKLNIEYDNYVIFGACNPPLAHRALQAEKEVGLLLPCNVIVYEEGGKTHVSAMLPSAAMGLADNPALGAVAAEAEEKLKRAVDAV